MMNLAEYRKRPALLADYLPWAAIVAPGVVLNKDGSFQRTARFRGPDLDSATPAELVGTTARLNNALRRLGSPRRAPEASLPTLNPSRQTRSALSLSFATNPHPTQEIAPGTRATPLASGMDARRVKTRSSRGFSAADSPARRATPHESAVAKAARTIGASGNAGNPRFSRILALCSRLHES
jgi:hypothetical protein